ncbi:MAG: M23 family metallopeptidase [Acidobacteriota bacterium]
MSLYVRQPRRSSPWGRRLLAILIIGAVGVLGLAIRRTGPPPTITIEPALPGIGPATPVRVELAEPSRGLSRIEVELVQGEQVMLLAEREHVPRPFWAFWGPAVETERLEVTVGREHQPDLRPGEATIRVRAERASTWIVNPEPAVLEQILPVRFEAPSLVALRQPYRVDQGGSGVVVYRVGASSTRDGVRVGEHFFAGYDAPRPEVPGRGSDAATASESVERFAFYGVPDDHAEASEIRLVAEDELGNRIETAFLQSFVPRTFTGDEVQISDAFLERVVPPILAQTPELEPEASLVETYVKINSELRAANTRELIELAATSRSERMWSGAFSQLPNSVVTGTFGDRRIYLYQGQEIDRATHLGYDLASVREAPVPAANAGVVVLARFFGIYGNTVVIDHGQGVLSLYSHLSSIEVASGQEVERGTRLGRTGITGLSGGDHLHFTIMVGSVQVSPLEWWDRGWIDSRIESKLRPNPEPAGTP